MTSYTYRFHKAGSCAMHGTNNFRLAREYRILWEDCLRTDGQLFNMLYSYFKS